VILLLLWACTATEDTGEPPTCTPATPGSSAEGWPLDGWSWARQGPLLPERAPQAGDGDLGPDLVVVDGGLRLFFTRKQGPSHQLYTSQSSDGSSWSTPTPLTGLPEDDFQAYPAVVHTGDRYLLWYVSGGLDLAESVDGEQFTAVADEVLEGSGDFDTLGVLYPTVAGSEGAWELWYTGFDGQEHAIGRATSTDGRDWQAHGAVLARTEGGFDNRSVAQPEIHAEAGALLLWYGGYDTSRTDPGPWRVGLAASPDGSSWSRRGVSLPLDESGPDAWSTRDPTVVRWGSGWLMVYVGMGTDGAYRLLLATSDTCAPGR